MADIANPQEKIKIAKKSTFIALFVKNLKLRIFAATGMVWLF